jgi:hypothetical protein
MRRHTLAAAPAKSGIRLPSDRINARAAIGFAVLKLFPQVIEDVTLPDHSIAANIGLALDQELEHEQSLLELAEAGYVVHDRRAGTVLGQDDASPLSLIRASSWLASLLNSLRLMMHSPIAIE